MKKILIGVFAFLLLAVGLIIIFLPATTHIERTIMIDAPPAVAYASTVDLREFHKWSPWTGRDPNANYEFSDPSSGVNASMSWSGNEQVGEGKMTITKAFENEGIELDLDFGSQGGATSAWLFEQNGLGTKATWAFDTGHGFNPIARVFGAFFMDGMIGPDYEKGLQNLKDHCEAKQTDIASDEDAATP
ncbi:MAG: SRPBCC family protein [Planctomycetales bacterium]|nr:SRPBCC family protein [Planctomycetales bacterium]